MQPVVHRRILKSFRWIPVSRLAMCAIGVRATAVIAGIMLLSWQRMRDASTLRHSPHRIRTRSQIRTRIPTPAPQLPLRNRNRVRKPQLPLRNRNRVREPQLPLRHRNRVREPQLPHRARLLWHRAVLLHREWRKEVLRQARIITQNPIQQRFRAQQMTA